MDKINKEKTKDFIEWFIVFWMSAVAVSPYFLVSMSITLINFELGSEIFNYLADFISLPVLTIVLIFVGKDNFSIGGIREFIANNAKKVFLIGVIFFYVIAIVSVFFDLGNFIPALMNIILSCVAFPVMFFILKFGQKIFKKVKEEVNKNIMLNDIKQ